MLRASGARRTHPDLLDSAARAAAEAVTLEDLSDALPLLKRGLGASYIHLCQFDDAAAPLRMIGDTTAVDSESYFSRYFDEDPITAVNRSPRAKIYLPAGELAPGAFEKSTAYNEFYRPHEIDRLLCARLTELRADFKSMVGLIAFRGRSQPEFSPGDVRALARVLPAFEAVARRSRRVDDLLDRETGPLAALVARADPRAMVALDASGRTLWVSPAAEPLLAPFLGGRRALPEALVGAARRLAAFAAGDDPGRVAYDVKLDGAPGVSLAVELRLERTGIGEPFVVADLEPRVRDPAAPVAQLAARHGLSRAEAEVLAALSRGLSNAEIARSRFVSTETVKTHVRRIFEKLGVKSRLQAVVLARPG